MKRVVTMQDISCIGKCSVTVALPILSVLGIECAILPTAVLSTHTAFEEFSFKDLTPELDKILEHWKKQNFKMDGVYTGYLGSIWQVKFVEKLMEYYKDGIHLVDPAMADFGKLYKGFDDKFVLEMANLCQKSDMIVPNLTEICLLLGIEYKDDYNVSDIKDMLKRLADKGSKKVLMTGFSSSKNSLGAICYDREIDNFIIYENEKLSESFHGTGDIFASTLFGNLVNGKSLEDSMAITVDFVLEAIKKTVNEENHNTYGVNFEYALPYLIKRAY